VKLRNGIEYMFVGAYEEIEISLILPPKVQLRTTLGDVDSLASSIRENGLIEPIVVRPQKDHFEIVTGNRRYVACRKLKFRRIPSLVVNFDDRQAYEAALVENIQRKTLDPIEEAESFKRYCEEFGWGSQSELAKRIGKSQEYVSHRLQLLSLPEKAKELIKARVISSSIAEEIAWLRDPVQQEKLLDLVAEEKLNREQTRHIVKTIRNIREDGHTQSSVADLDWTNLSSKREILNPDESVIERAILTLRISMVRLDSLIEKAQSKILRKVLLDKRVAIHELQNDLIAYKMNRNKVEREN
jgi:ParB family chromosome partitioning protein